MQLNTTTALVTALLSAVIGFGLAFFIERKLSGGMQKKSQKILTSIAMISFGYGLMATLNEFIGFHLQGLSIRYDKLAVFVVANILFLPIILIAIAKFIGSNERAVAVDLGGQSNSAAGALFKYFLMFVGTLSIAYFGYIALQGHESSSEVTYNVYTKVDYNNCSSPFQENPGLKLKFSFKKDTNEVFMTAEFSNGSEKLFEKLENCSVLNSKNWTCGGIRKGPYITPTYKFIDGSIVYDKGFTDFGANCDWKFVKQ